MMLLASLKAYFFLADAINTPCTLSTSDTFFGLPHWWQYMKGQTDGIGGCTPVFNGLNDIFPIGLALINILLHIAGFVAVIGIIVSGVSYMVAIGNPEKITSARKGIQNSVIGLAIALIAAQIVAFIGKSLT